MWIALTLLALQAAPLSVAPAPLPQADAAARVALLFADLDVDENGVIDRDEARAHFDLEATANATFEAARKSQKASAPRPEVTAPRHDWSQADAWFDAVDGDKDGKITPAELSAYQGADRVDLGVQ